MSTITAILRGGQYRYLPAHYLVRPLRTRQILATAPVASARFDDHTVPEVHLLTGAAHIPDLLYAAKSFLLYFDGPVRIVVHGDTSVGEAEHALILQHLPEAKVVTRAHSTPEVEAWLADQGYHHCVRFRQQFVLAAKIFDSLFYCEVDRFLLLDTDTLSFGRLHEFEAALTAPKPANVFGRDPLPQPYTPFDFGFRLADHLNSGSSIVARDTIDLARIDDWLAKGFPPRDHFSEQTLLAAAATQAGATLLSSAYDVGGTPNKQAVFSHYCGHKLSKARSHMRVQGQARVLAALRARR